MNRSNTPNPKEVLHIADTLEAWLNELPKCTPGHVSASIWKRRREAVATLKVRIENMPWGPGHPRIRVTPVTTTISMMGYQASGTAGLEAACQNWISQVRRKLQGAALKERVADE